MKFGIIKERKNPPDRRVVFSPEALLRLQKEYPQAHFKVESSDIRFFTDEQYANLGFEVSTEISDCDVLFGVKEVPVEALKEKFLPSLVLTKKRQKQKQMQPYNL